MNVVRLRARDMNSSARPSSPACAGCREGPLRTPLREKKMCSAAPEVPSVQTNPLARVALFPQGVSNLWREGERLFDLRQSRRTDGASGRRGLGRALFGVGPEADPDEGLGVDPGEQGRRQWPQRLDGLLRIERSAARRRRGFALRGSKSKFSRTLIRPFHTSKSSVCNLSCRHIITIRARKNTCCSSDMTQLV
jgi:hypothetical protein